MIIAPPNRHISSPVPEEREMSVGSTLHAALVAIDCLSKDSALAQPPKKGMVCHTTFDPI